MYTVKQGDRLSEIARQLGVKTSDLTGYRSGDPNLIYPGEVITTKKKNIRPAPLDAESEGALRTNAFGVREMLDPTGKWRPVDTAGGEAYQVERKAHSLDTPTIAPSAYRSEFGTATPQAGTTPGTTATTSPTTDYNKKREDAFSALQNLRTTTYNTEYKNKGLDKVKGQIRDLDIEIQNVRNARDESILKTRQNPYLSASALAGDVSKLADKYNANLNTLIQQRNALAGDYNTSLKEIETSVDNALRDKAMELEYWGNLADQEEKQKSTYMKMLMDGLKDKQSQSNFEKQLAQQLEIARMRGSGSGSDYAYRYLTNPLTGELTSWIDPRNMRVYPANAPQQENSSGLTPVQLQKINALISTGMAPETARATVLQPQEEKGGFVNWIRNLFN